MSGITGRMLGKVRLIGTAIGRDQVVVLYRCQHGCCGRTEWLVEVFDARVAIAMSPQFACVLAKGATDDSFLAVFAECQGGGSDGTVTETCMEISRRKVGGV